MNDFTLNSDEETADILADPETMAALKQSAADVERGDVLPWEVVKANLEKHE